MKPPADSLTLAELLSAYPDAAAERLFVVAPLAQRHHLSVLRRPERPGRHRPPGDAFHCRACERFFSVRTGTVMQRSKIGYRGWLIAMHRVLPTGGKWVDAQIQRDLGINYRSAWFLRRRICEAYNAGRGSAWAAP